MLVKSKPNEILEVVSKRIPAKIFGSMSRRICGGIIEKKTSKGIIGTISEGILGEIHGRI